MARKERTVKNGIAAIVKYFIKLVLQFVLRTIIIYKLGVEYVGLDSLYANIISMLSLAELGIGSAIVFSMYKPAAENDIEKLKSLNNLYKRMYFVISLVVLAVGLAIMPFIEHLISGKPNVDVNLYVVYAVFLANTVISYLGAHKRSLLFAYQRHDIETNILTIQLILMSIAQIGVLLIFKNYYLYVIMIPLFSLIEVILVIVISNIYYPEINGKSQPLDKETKITVKRNIIGASCHQIGSVLVMSTDNLLVSMFFGLTVLGRVSNYILIYNAIYSLFMIFINALQASVGNLITTTEKEKVYKYYKTFSWFFACVGGFCTISLMCLYQPFMRLWNVIADNSMGLMSVWFVLALAVRFYVTSTRAVTNMFKNCAGLMWNDRIKPIIETIVNIVASIALIYVMGVEGIFVGTIISTITVPLWVEPLVLHKNYFKLQTKVYFKTYILYAAVTSIAGILSYFLCSLLPYGIVYFILRAVICVVITSIIYLLCYFRTQEFNSVKDIVFKALKKIFKKKN